MSSEIYKQYSRCFNTPAGRAVLEHLRSITIERFVGPDASDAHLRHAEGQRALVHQIQGMIKRGE
jgi:hypothetical protein